VPNSLRAIAELVPDAVPCGRFRNVGVVAAQNDFAAGAEPRPASNRVVLNDFDPAGECLGDGEQA
jgi:hypothetical protein